MQQGQEEEEEEVAAPTAAFILEAMSRLSNPFQDVPLTLKTPSVTGVKFTS